MAEEDKTTETQEFMTVDQISAFLAEYFNGEKCQECIFTIFIRYQLLYLLIISYCILYFSIFDGTTFFKIQIIILNVLLKVCFIFIFPFPFILIFSIKKEIRRTSQ